MDGEKLFKSALGGFNKNDVMQYINTLNTRLGQEQGNTAKLQAERDGLQAELTGATAAGEQAKEAFAQAEGQRDEAGARLADLDAFSSQQKSAIIALQQELEEKKSLLEEKEKALSLAEEENSLLQKRCADYESRSRLYDSSAREIADVMVKARKDADEIVENANMDATLKRERADREIHRAVEDYSIFKNKMLSLKGEALSKLQEAIEQVEGMDGFLGDIEAECAFPHQAREVPDDENSFLGDAEAESVFQSQESETPDGME